MYSASPPSSGLGFNWGAILKIGGQILATAGPLYLQHRLQSDQMKAQLRLQLAQQQAQVPASGSAMIPTPYQLPEQQIIAGVPNIALLGGGAILVFVLLSKR